MTACNRKLSCSEDSSLKSATERESKVTLLYVKCENTSRLSQMLACCVLGCVPGLTERSVTHGSPLQSKEKYYVFMFLCSLHIKTVLMQTPECSLVSSSY